MVDRVDPVLVREPAALALADRHQGQVPVRSEQRRHPRGIEPAVQRGHDRRLAVLAEHEPVPLRVGVDDVEAVRLAPGDLDRVLHVRGERRRRSPWTRGCGRGWECARTGRRNHPLPRARRGGRAGAAPRRSSRRRVPFRHRPAGGSAASEGPRAAPAAGRSLPSARVCRRRGRGGGGEPASRTRARGRARCRAPTAARTPGT